MVSLHRLGAPRVGLLETGPIAIGHVEGRHAGHRFPVKFFVDISVQVIDEGARKDLGTMLLPMIAFPVEGVRDPLRV